MQNKAKPLYFSLKNYYFSSGWWFLIATVLMVSLLIYLGYWQLSRAHYKENLQTIFQTRSIGLPITNAINLPINTDLRFQAATFTGYFDNAHQFLLDNKIYDHQVGYQVLTPLKIAGQNIQVLINRGWIPQGNNRNKLPIINAVENEVTVSGILNAPDHLLTLNAKLASSSGWPKVVSNIDTTAITTITKQKTFPYFLLLDAKEPYGFVRNWQPFSGKISMHYGYAFQWFALAVTLMIIYFALNIHPKKPKG